MDQVSDALHLKHYSYRTEQSYLNWIRRYILYHNKTHPKDMGEAEIQVFLTHLVTERNVSESTQSQALSALIFLYRSVLHNEFGFPSGLITAKCSTHLLEAGDDIRTVQELLGDKDVKLHTCA